VRYFMHWRSQDILCCSLRSRSLSVFSDRRIWLCARRFMQLPSTDPPSLLLPSLLTLSPVAMVA